MSQAVESRDVFRSRIGTILSFAGLAIGLGNCWRFPYLCGYWGGGSFVFAYLVGVIIIVAPLAIVEVAMGKGMQKGLIDTYGTTFKNKPLGYVLGTVSGFGQWAQNFYFVAIGSTVVYFIFGCLMSLWNKMGAANMYGNFSANKPVAIGIYIIFLIAILYTGYKGVSKGIEAVSKIMIPGLFVIFIVTFIMTAMNTPHIVDGLNYYLNPDWSKLKNPNLWVAAVSQALFSIGVGPGALLIYGSHIRKDGEISLTVLTVCALDTCAGLVAGLCIIPACIAYGINPQAGPTLIFQILPVIFSEMPMGSVIGALLFFGIFFAAFTTACSNQETAVTSFSDAYHISRGKMIIILGIINLIFGLVCLFNDGFNTMAQLLTGDLLFMPFSVISGIAYVYVFGVKRIREKEIVPYSNIRLGRWFDKWVQFVALPIMVCLCAKCFISALG